VKPFTDEAIFNQEFNPWFWSTFSPKCSGLRHCLFHICPSLGPGLALLFGGCCCLISHKRLTCDFLLEDALKGSKAEKLSTHRSCVIESEANDMHTMWLSSQKGTLGVITAARAEKWDRLRGSELPGHEEIKVPKLEGSTPYIMSSSPCLGPWLVICPSTVIILFAAKWPPSGWFSSQSAQL